MQFPQESICVKVLLIKFQDPRTATLLKRDFNRGFSCKICKLFKSALFNRTSPVAASDSFGFPVCNFIKKETPQNMFFCKVCEILRTFFLLTEHLRMTTSCVYLWIFHNFLEFFKVFQNNSFKEQLWEVAYFMYKNYRIPTTRYSNSQVYLTGAFQAFYTRARSNHWKAFIYLKSLKTVCEEVNL